jgi:iron complex transport system substrate-binding protein
MLMRGLWAACLLVGLSLLPARADPPARVVSINLCTDQLALMLAAPGQLVSVTMLAQDPQASVMAEPAASLHANHGLVEEIALLRPDLVLASSFTNPVTLGLLRRLGVRVETFAPAIDLAGIRGDLLRMGDLLGRSDAANLLVAQFDADLAALRAADPRGRAAPYAANGYVEGPMSLTGLIINLAGYTNIADEMGLGYGGTVPLEVLMLQAPDLVIRAAASPGHSRADAVADHPALRDIAPQIRTDRDWTCGTPAILSAARHLRAAP